MSQQSQAGHYVVAASIILAAVLLIIFMPRSERCCCCCQHPAVAGSAGQASAVIPVEKVPNDRRDGLVRPDPGIAPGQVNDAAESPLDRATVPAIADLGELEVQNGPETGAKADPAPYLGTIPGMEALDPAWRRRRHCSRDGKILDGDDPRCKPRRDVPEPGGSLVWFGIGVVVTLLVLRPGRRRG